MTAHTAAGRTGYGSTWTQKGALVFGVVFLIVGIAGFVPGLTMDMGTMSAAGNGSMAHLLGLFRKLGVSSRTEAVVAAARIGLKFPNG